MIRITKTGSPYFEEAFFVLKADVSIPEDDIVKEAMRIAERATESLKKDAARKRRISAQYVFLGAAGAAFLLGGAMMVISLFAVMG